MSVASAGLSAAGGVSSSKKDTSVASTGSKAASGASSVSPKAAAATAAAVKAASPTTKVSSSGGIASAGNASAGAGDGLLQSFSGAAFKGENSAGGVAPAIAASRADPAGSDAAPNWMQFQDFLDTMSPVRTSGVTRENGAPGNYADFAQNVQNGSLGVPRAAGYGLSADPTAQQAFDPLSGLGSGLSNFWRGLVDNAHRNEAARMANPPFAGAVDTNAPWYKDYANKFYSTTGVAQPALGGPTTTVVPTTRVSGLQPNDWPAQIAALMARGARLPSEIVPTGAMPPAPPAYPPVDQIPGDPSSREPAIAAIGDLTSGIGLPRRDPRGYPGDVFANDGLMTTADGTVLRAGVPATPGSGSISAAKPSMWDNVVDNTGKLLSHTGLGSIVSGMFPDIWNGAGSAIKNLLDNGGAETKYPTDMATALAGLAGGQQSSGNGGQQGAPSYTDFIDLNHNGIDDRTEGYVPPVVPPVVPPASTQFAANRDVLFPNSGYRPGIDPEWSYFRNHLALGGEVVGSGGPTADAVPAVIDGQHPARLSSGEYVIPVAAVEGIGAGDHKLGAERLAALSAYFSSIKGA